METINKRRFHFIDELRGILILYVVAYHLLYDVSQIFYVDSISWMYSPWMNLLRNCMVGMLIAIAGISCTLSRNNGKRGIRILLIALGLSFVTAVAIPQEFVLFGILHFFGTAILIYAGLESVVKKIPVFLGMAVSVYLFAATFHLYEGYIGFPVGLPFQLPEVLQGFKPLYLLGFAIDGMYSADYYPLVPWIFLLFFGGFLGRFLKQQELPKGFYQLHSHRLATIGRHTLWIYLIHQPVIYGVLYLITKL